MAEKPPPEHSSVPSLDTVSVTQQRGDGTESGEKRQIGPYRILREIGHGGMGVVYEAEQEKPVRRKVALKLIKSGMDTKAVIARFESERQALALMNHPNIASVYDAGATNEGRPYFAMEYIQGIPITKYCDKHRLTIQERLELFIQVCEGVQHAHQKGIIHRDIKPSNVLVAVQDAKPVPKIIDFGVAKATSQRLTEHSIHTGMGQLIGTPEYMRPEQAEMTNLDIDTRTDVYSLGALLYELLAGAQPFDPKELRREGLAEIQRKLREDEPPKPSTRVSELGEASGASAANRRVVLTAWVKQLSGDLDWITVRAMEKDRTRRYASPLELAADVKRYLRHEPVLARPPSTSYRVRKYVRRNRVGVAAAALILLALIIGLAGTTAGMIRATRAEKKANIEAIKAQTINEFLLDTLGSANPIAGGRLDVTVLEALDGAVEAIGESFADQPEIEAAVSKTVGRTYLRLSQYEKAEDLLGRALELEKRVLGDDHTDTVESLLFMGVVHMERGQLDQAEPFYQQALERSRRLWGDNDVHVGVALFNLGGIAHARDNLDEAESFYRESLAIGPQSEDERDLEWATTLLAWVLAQKGDYEEAESLFASAVAGRRNLLGNDHPLVADALLGLGGLTSRQLQNQNAPPPGDCAKAVPMFEEAAAIYDKNYGEEAVQFALPRLFLGGCLTKLERHEEAEQQLRAAYPLL